MLWASKTNTSGLNVHLRVMTHSGLQFGGLPVYPWRQEQAGCPLISLHSENGPHGEGTHGLTGLFVSTGIIAVTCFSQLENGFPVYPGLQEHMGLCWWTLQLALMAQDPGHGSTQREFKQALSRGHSLFVTHSGLQFGGDPTNSGRQEQTATPFNSLQLLFNPHGDGWHGFWILGGSGGGGAGKLNLNSIPWTRKRIKMQW